MNLSPTFDVSMSRLTMAFAPLSRACLIARVIASARAFSISDVKAEISPPPIDCSTPMITPPTPLVLGDNPLANPITFVILYPGIVGVVTTLKSPLFILLISIPYSLSS